MSPDGSDSTHTEQANYMALVDQIDSSYNQDELVNLCFKLGVEYDNLPGNSKYAKVREFVLFMRRRNRIDELLEFLSQERKTIDWRLFKLTTQFTDTSNDIDKHKSIFMNNGLINAEDAYRYFRFFKILVVLMGIALYLLNPWQFYLFPILIFTGLYIYLCEEIIILYYQFGKNLDKKSVILGIKLAVPVLVILGLFLSVMSFMMIVWNEMRNADPQFVLPPISHDYSVVFYSRSLVIFQMSLNAIDISLLIFVVLCLGINDVIRLIRFVVIRLLHYLTGLGEVIK